MTATGTITAKGQVTVPKAVRDALGLEEGDKVSFRIENGEAVVSKIPNFIDLAGFIHVPPEKRGADWDEIVRETRADRAARRR